ncbi:hypothetical protein DFS34DRAFT_561664, partial [Phlyctochytrium arcticum]
YADRGAGTILDTYDEDERVELARYFMNRNFTNGLGLRDRAVYLLMRATCSRGETLRQMQLCDMWFRNLTGDEGPTTPCNVLGFTIRQGKTTNAEKAEFRGVMRHKDVELC